MISFPSLYSPLPTPVEMHSWDKAASEHFKISTVLLMENAAQAAFKTLQCRFPLTRGTTVLIIMGKGNNGGDGAALGRLLHDHGCKVIVCSVAPLEGLPSPAKEHVEMARAIGVSFVESALDSQPALPMEWSHPDIIVDAIAGTGLKGPLRSREQAWVTHVNNHHGRAFIFSLDIPSGLCGLTGKALPDAVRADLTVSFEAGKPGLYTPEARQFTGQLIIQRVGIPHAVRTLFPASWELLTPRSGMFPGPSPERHKGSAGKVLIIGGSNSMPGAPLLAAAGALRTGAGLVHVAIPGNLADLGHTICPECLVHPIGNTKEWGTQNTAQLIDLIGTINPQAIVVGPGMGQNAEVCGLVKALLELITRPPAIIDADALNCIAKRSAPSGNHASSEGVPYDLRPVDILTPHPGEMARLLPDSFFPESILQNQSERTRQVQTDRASALHAFVQRCSSVLVLKGAGTLIGLRGYPIVMSPIAVPTLAVGGSGDVLSGIIAALKASGISSRDAACLGVYMHGRAGEILADKAPLGHLARDIADTLPIVWKELCIR